MDWNNTYFISSGSENKMFTLRVGGWSGWGQFKRKTTFYISNLSTDYDTALEKAKEYASAHGGFFWEAKGEFELNEIIRMASGERAKLVEKANRKLAAEKAEREEKRYQEELTHYVLNKGKFLGGKYDGETFEDVFSSDPQYCFWFVEKYEPKTKVREKFFADFIQFMDGRVNPETDFNDVFLGEIGKREDFDVVVVAHCSFEREGYSYYSPNVVVNVYTFKDVATGGNITTFSSGKFEANVGEHLTIKGTVKDHTVYKDIKQTVINRVARAKVKK